MLAIPSPDVVVNLFASLGQLLALLSILVGGAAVSVRRKEKDKKRGRSSRGLLWATGALAVTSTVSFALYYTYVQDLRNTRLRMNLVRSSTEAGKAVGDVSLKTLSFSGQEKHPAGIGTKALREAIAAGKPLNLIDIRETEEVEAGRIPGSWHVRYPDIKHDRKGLVQGTAQTVLLCFSGNRSSELATEFVEGGVDCKFMIGGYEKWIAENGALSLGSATSRDALRQLPVVPNADVLLDTPEATAAVIERNALFVDVRYPADYERGHLPGAINLPIRKLRTDELRTQLEALDAKRPIIVPCYDKRSSFYASILGVKLSRMNREFVGRYTVPHEFFLAPSAKVKSHVAAWQAQRAGTTPLGTVKGWLASALNLLTNYCEGLALAIFVLVLLVRGLLSPLSFKADLDQWRRQRLDPEVRELRRRFADDPARAQRGIVKLYRDSKLTPLRNLFISVGQLLLFLSFFAVVQEAATGSNELFFGYWTLGKADPIGIFPILVGALMAAVMCNGKVSRKKAVFAALLGVGLAALTWQLPVAANLYLVTSLVWVVIQGHAARYIAELEAPQVDDIPEDQSVATFDEAGRAPLTGNKAIRLGQLKTAGLPVPNGFALSDACLQKARRAGGLLPEDRARILELHRRLKAPRVAVRSSGLKEDGGEKSYAGVFESVLDVTSDGLFEAIEFVRSSMDSDRARAYGDGDEQGGIVVQAMVPAEYAGVLFTEHPGSSGSMLVELVEGLCEQLVGGTVTPKAFEFRRATGRLVGDEAPVIDLEPLLELGRKVEKLFAAPQDIEWAFADNRFYLLQARDITVGSGSGNTAEARRQAERARLMSIVMQSAARPAADDVAFGQNELSELLPDPTTFSLAFMNSLWTAGGSVDLACRSMGVPYDVTDDSPDYVEDVFGRLYVNRREEQRRLAKGLGGLASYRLTRGADAMEAEFREEFLPAFHRRLRILEATDLKLLSDSDLADLWRETREEFVESTYVEAERINIAADFFVKSATEQLGKRNLNPGAALANIPETVVHRAFQLLPGIKAGTTPADEFVAVFGHRAPHDFEFSEPRYAEDPSAVEALAKRTQDVHTAPAGKDESGDVVEVSRVLQITIDRARRFQALKEEAKHEAMRELALFRRLTLEVGRRAGVEDQILWLTPDEVDALQLGTLQGRLERIIEERLETRECFDNLEMPVRVTVDYLESMTMDDGPVIPRHDVEGSLRGQRVAGNKEVVSRVRVIRKVEELDEFVEGEILVARFTDPTWSTVFPIAGGLITEVGGWLSHAAIQAREYGLACIVDVSDAGSILNTGELIRLGLDGTIERLEAQPLAEDGTGRILRFEPPVPKALQDEDSARNKA